MGEGVSGTKPLHPALQSPATFCLSGSSLSPRVQALVSFFHLSRKQSLQGDNTGFNMIYRIGVKGDDKGLQSVDARLSVSSLPVAFRSGFCLQRAEVTGEETCSSQQAGKSCWVLVTRKGQARLEKRSELVAGWEKESRCFDFLLASEHSLFVDVAGMTPLVLFGDIFPA